MSFRWTREKPLYRVGDDDVFKGDEFAPTEAVKDRFAEWLEPVESDDTVGVEADDPTCGVNGCSRSVDSPEETCWQHSAE